MLIRVLVATLCMGVAASFTFVEEVSAQDCGNSCRACGFGHEGYGYAPDGRYNMQCFDWIPYCVACPDVEFSGEEGPLGEHIAAVVASGSSQELETALTLNRDRLLFSAARQLLVVRGTSCDQNALASVVLLPPSKAATVARFRLDRLESYGAKGE